MAANSTQWHQLLLPDSSVWVPVPVSQELEAAFSLTCFNETVEHTAVFILCQVALRRGEEHGRAMGRLWNGDAAFLPARIVGHEVWTSVGAAEKHLKSLSYPNIHYSLERWRVSQ